MTSTRVLQIATVVLALAASACGGGGGTTPSVGGPGPGSGSGTGTATPSPSSTATAAPTHAPTPTPTPVQTTAPTSAPTSPGAGITILPNTTGRFGLVQVLDQYSGAGCCLTQSQIQAEAPHFDSIWGTFSPQSWSSAHPGMLLSRYYLSPEDAYLISGNTLSYFQANHPDWILYGCDSNGNPTTHYAWSGSGFANDVPLDIHNPAVVQYQLGTILKFLRANGYNALAIDNDTYVNYLKSPNQILEGVPAQANWYGCGVYTQGPSVPSSFVRRYTTGFNQPDSAWTADLNNWIAQARATLHPYGIKILVNHAPHDLSPDSDEMGMLPNIDGMLDEVGYTHYGTLWTGNNFQATLNWIEYLQQHGIAALVTDYFCSGSNCSDDPNSLTPQQVDWALSSYAVGNEGGEDVYISPHGGGLDVYRNEYADTYGSACGPYSTVGTFLYERKFSRALVVVNASGSATSFGLPSGHSYTDIEGRPVTNPLTLNAADGYVLLTSNGCS